MSRILVDLPEAQLQALNARAETEQRPRAALVRDAIAAYLAQHRQAHDADVFGLWKDKKVDGIEYRRGVRSEW